MSLFIILYRVKWVTLVEENIILFKVMEGLKPIISFPLLLPLHALYNSND